MLRKTSSSRVPRGLSFMAFEQLQPGSTPKPRRRGPTGGPGSSIDYPRVVATKVVAKSADVLSQMARTNSGDLARRRHRAYRCGTRPASGERSRICICLDACKPLGFERLCPWPRSRPAPAARGALRVSFGSTEFSHSTPMLIEWLCHRLKYRADL